MSQPAVAVAASAGAVFGVFGEVFFFEKYIWWSFKDVIMDFLYFNQILESKETI